MARMMARPRPRQGRGIGEVLSEYFVYIIVVAGLVVAARWYFFSYLPSPSHALGVFLGAVKTGNYKTQYDLMPAAVKSSYGSAANYDDKCPLAHGLAARVEAFTITKMTETGDKAEADVTMTVRKSGEKLYQAGSDTFNDHYVLHREADGWKVVLQDPGSRIQSAAAITTR